MYSFSVWPHHNLLRQALLLYFTDEETSSRRLYNLPKGHMARNWPQPGLKPELLDSQGCIRKHSYTATNVFCMFLPPGWKHVKEVLAPTTVRTYYKTSVFGACHFLGYFIHLPHWATHTSLNALLKSWHTNVFLEIWIQQEASNCLSHDQSRVSWPS